MWKHLLCKTVLVTALNPAAVAMAQERFPVTRQAENVELDRASFNGQVSLTLHRAVEIALERNPLLLVEKIRVEQARERTSVETGQYDTLLNAGATVARRDHVVASRFYPTGLYVEQHQTPSISLESRTRTGGHLRLGIDYSRLQSTSNTQTLSPQYSANLTVGYSQSLLRGFGRNAGEARIRVAQKGEEIARFNLFTRISQLIQQVEERYWNFTFLRQDLEGKRRRLQVTRELLRQSQDLLRAGTVAPVSVLQARAAVAQREEEVISAESQVEEFEDRLKNLLWLDLERAELNPVEEPTLQTIEFNFRESLSIALRRRPEIQALQKEFEQREAELKFAANQTLPQLDLITQYTMSGLSGKPSETCVDPTSSLCIPAGINVGGSVLAGKTGARDAFTSFFSTKPFDTWSVEMKLQIPFGNRAAKGRHTDASLRLLETTTNLRALRDQIAEEIRNAMRESQTARKRVDATRETIVFVEDQVLGVRRRFEAGLASSYDVLQALDELDRAKTAELQAIMDFNVGLSKVRLAEASILDAHNVELAELPRYDSHPRGND